MENFYTSRQIIGSRRTIFRDPATKIERERRRAGASKALEIIAGDDAEMRALIDGICKRERRRALAAC